ncbi:hypothetical protein MRX96_056197 [Rhipicephalus microplus]
MKQREKPTSSTLAAVRETKKTSSVERHRVSNKEPRARSPDFAVRCLTCRAATPPTLYRFPSSFVATFRRRSSAAGSEALATVHSRVTALAPFRHGSTLPSFLLPLAVASFLLAAFTVLRSLPQLSAPY